MTPHLFLTSIPADMHRPLLHYLNLPPGCCIDNQMISEHTKGQHRYELPESSRCLVLSERSLCQGKFSDIEQLGALHRKDPSLLPSVLEKLEDTARYGNRVVEVWGGSESLSSFFQLLESAESYIHISTYILGGDVGLQLAELLARKQSQGVEVRLMFCASGLVMSGSPSGTGFVSRLSDVRSFTVNDLYRRKRLIEKLTEYRIPFVDSSPIGFHWRRRSMKNEGISSARDYYRWARNRQIPEEWLEEQECIDRQCRIGFINVDHRKFAVIDGRHAYLGSQNIADSYFYTNELSEHPAVNRKNWQWHDSGYLLSGGAVHQLNDLFARRWWLSGGDRFDYASSRYKPAPRREGNSCVTIAPTIPGLLHAPFTNNASGFLATALGARKPLIIKGNNPVRSHLLELPALTAESLMLEHCYPSDSELLESWKHIPDSGKELKMIVPEHYDVFFLGRECDAHYPPLIDAGAHLYGYARAIMHTKVVLMDEFYTITGSYNLNLRSARADMECTFLIQDSLLGERVSGRLQKDLEDCRKMIPGTLMRYRSRYSTPVIDALLRYLFF